MVTPAANTVAFTPLTEEVQKAVIEQISKTTIAVTTDVFMVLLTSRALKPEEFVNTHIAPRQKEVSELDTRIQHFMQKLVEAVNVQIDQLPGSGIAVGFQTLAAYTNDPQVRDNLIKSVALDRVKLLAKQFDEINPEIIDKLISPKLS